MADSIDSSDYSRKRSKKSKKERRKKDHKRKSKKRRKRHYSDDDDDDSSYDRRRHSNKKHKKRHDTDDDSSHSDRRHRKKKKQRDSKKNDGITERNHRIVDALMRLLDTHSPLATDLPIMLIRLVGGTTFDLSQMTDVSAAEGLSDVFESMRPFGMECENGRMWSWKGPRHDELFLIRVLRATLEQVGFTMERIEAYETPKAEATVTGSTTRSKRTSSAHDAAHKTDSTTDDEISHVMRSLLRKFPQLGSELASLCKTILNGESVDISGLEDEALREELEQLFLVCGLEKSEMEGDRTEDEGVSLGYGLPEANSAHISSKLISVIDICEGKQMLANEPLTRRNQTTNVPDDQRPTDHSVLDEEDDEEEGPLPVTAQRVKGPRFPAHLAPQRVTAAREDSVSRDESGREEWMLDPGKYDFLAAHKSGQPLRSRGFEGKSRRSLEEPEQQPIDATTKAEIDAIMEAHEQSRGLSLLEQHRLKKAEEEANNASQGKKSWNWNRERDIDAGRRVDKEALGMILGGAGRDLKTKFQGGLG